VNKPFDVTLDNCHKEPIHIPGSIQPHGYLLLFEPKTLILKYCSENVADLMRCPLDALLEQPLDSMFDREFATMVKGLDYSKGFHEVNPQQTTPIAALAQGLNSNTAGPVTDTQAESIKTQSTYNAILSLHDDLLAIEIEPALSASSSSFNPVKNLINLSLNDLAQSQDLNNVFAYSVNEIRKVTGFDRVMLYKFDADYNGEVVAEAKKLELNSFLKQHFPESDIPKQARELYVKNPIRLLADVNAKQSMLYPNDRPVDLSKVTLRSVSPIHCQYLRNMGVNASMSISIVVSGKLWGLIACHHYSPHVVPFETREVALYMGLMLSYLISLKVQADAEHRDSAVLSLNASITAKMAERIFFTDGLREETDNLMRMMNASGVAWRLEEDIECFGKTPSPDRIEALFNWATSTKLVTDTIYHTKTLGKDNPDFLDISDVASGVFILSVSSVSNLFLIWFRQEVEQTKDWGGKPGKTIEFLDDGSHRLMPRSSFRLWRENVKNQSLAWEAVELSSALKFRDTIVNYVLSKSERLELLNEALEHKVAVRTDELKKEIANKEKMQDELVEALATSEESNRELERFAFVASHDLQEPLRKIQSFGGRIQQTEATLSDRGHGYLTKMMNSAERMQALIKGVLSFSRIHRSNDEFVPLNFDDIIEDVILDLEVLVTEKKATFSIDHIGVVYGDKNQLRRVAQNIIQNALKFTKEDVPPHIVIALNDKAEDFVTIEFKDNGVGFAKTHEQKIFGLFERLHSKAEYSGTGLGLAICKKIINRHQGKIWAESHFGQGASFFITLPTSSGALE
jgi:light-regulated signal transduction histidine kinase (bacteriophytochrome)